jgi:hypothetical protein
LSLTSGNFNTAVGLDAGNTGGSENTAIGVLALRGTGSRNTATGYLTLYNNTTGAYNTVVGALAGLTNTSGSFNTLVGDSTDVITGALTNATAIGHRAQVGISNAISLGDSTKNTTVGIGTSFPDKAGLVVNNTVGGYVHAMFGSHTTGVAIESNWPGIGFNAYYNGGRKFINNGYAGHINVAQDNGSLYMLIHGTGNAGSATTVEKGVIFSNGSGTTGAFTSFIDNAYTLGSSTRFWTTIYATNGTINTCDARMKKNISSLPYGLKEIMQLKPVSYQWKNPAAGEQVMLGLLAQDVQKVLPEIISEQDGKLGMRSAELIPVLIKAIQEQQKEIESLRKIVEGMTRVK